MPKNIIRTKRVFYVVFEEEGKENKAMETRLKRHRNLFTLFSVKKVKNISRL